MASNDPLTIFEEPSGLRQPVLILAFSGWNDAAESATESPEKFAARLRIVI